MKLFGVCVQVHVITYLVKQDSVSLFHKVFKSLVHVTLLRILGASAKYWYSCQGENQSSKGTLRRKLLNFVGLLFDQYLNQFQFVTACLKGKFQGYFHKILQAISYYNEYVAIFTFSSVFFSVDTMNQICNYSPIHFK